MANRFPHPLYLVHHLPSNSYGSVYIGDVRALACFADAGAASHFSRQMETSPNLIVEMAMADACEVARYADVNALAMADDLSSPAVHLLAEHESRS